MKTPFAWWKEQRCIRRGAKRYAAQQAEAAAARARQAEEQRRGEKRSRAEALLTALLGWAQRPQASAPSRKLTAALPTPGVVPAAALDDVLAQDAMPYPWLAEQYAEFQYSFPGYPYLAQLLQMPEYRKMIGRLATEMTREFVKLKVSGEGDFAEEIEALEKDLRTFRVAAHFRKLVTIGQGFGRAQLYLDVTTPKGSTRAYDDPKELNQKLDLTSAKVPKNCLRGFRVIEPMWSYPGVYNSIDPLKPFYYDPQLWFVMGKQVHVSRLLPYVPHPVPDILKAAYSFGGLSLSQLAEPYVNNWIRTRQAVSDVVSNFSTSGLKTDLSSILQSGWDDGAAGAGPEPGGDVVKRVELFSQMKTNRSTWVLDKETEEFFQLNTPLGTLDKLQAQAQEQMSAISNMPLVVLTGITPTGLNASSEGEIRVWYDYVNAEKEAHFNELFEVVLKVLMLNRFGRVIPEITYEWPALYQLSDDQKAAARKSQADTDSAYIQAGVFSPEEIRAARTNDDDGMYSSIKGDHEDQDDSDDDGDHEEQPGENEGDPSFRTDTRAAAGR